LVSFRADQDLCHKGRSVAVAGEEDGAGREAAPGAGAGDHEPDRVDAEIVGVLRGPDEGPA
jgi:hypothetical protein